MPLVLKVRETRDRLGITRTELAKRSGVSLRALAYVESGRDVKVSTVQAIAAALGVSIGELFGEAA